MNLIFRAKKVSMRTLLHFNVFLVPMVVKVARIVLLALSH